MSATPDSVADTTDPEMDAIIAVGHALAQLDGAARRRVLRWANDRFAAATDQPPAPASTRTSTNRQPLSEKREAILDIMRAQPGRWTPADMRAALKARGVNPQEGTPVKNILWHLAKAGTITAAGGGVYEFPPLTVPLGERDDR